MLSVLPGLPRVKQQHVVGHQGGKLQSCHEYNVGLHHPGIATTVHYLIRFLQRACPLQSISPVWRLQQQLLATWPPASTPFCGWVACVRCCRRACFTPVPSTALCRSSSRLSTSAAAPAVSRWLTRTSPICRKTAPAQQPTSEVSC